MMFAIPLVTLTCFLPRFRRFYSMIRKTAAVKTASTDD